MNIVHPRFDCLQSMVALPFSFLIRSNIHLLPVAKRLLVTFLFRPPLFDMLVTDLFFVLAAFHEDTKFLVFFGSHLKLRHLCVVGNALISTVSVL